MFIPMIHIPVFQTVCASKLRLRLWPVGRGVVPPRLSNGGVCGSAAAPRLVFPRRSFASRYPPRGRTGSHVGGHMTLARATQSGSLGGRGAMPECGHRSGRLLVLGAGSGAADTDVWIGEGEGDDIMALSLLTPAAANTAAQAGGASLQWRLMGYHDGPGPSCLTPELKCFHLRAPGQ
ncbi:hypothetical protein AAFF_G00184820 [Aldrovandia affinis]|uniref:Uncharacterized protein n=1 Tax=Aldrovandia affinis TaxID=143900 RepID=A0AAD7W6T8_9TELE|nr:hypothetical protein AAFF_G00184820 [Aldrovandia affinis]